MVPGESIEMRLIEGPFEKLRGEWKFLPLEETGCRIELVLDFEFKGGFAGKLIAPAFTRIANTMVDSFCQRAHELHGK